MQLFPAPINSGIRLRRTDIEGAQAFAADPFAVKETLLCTGLTHEDGSTINTVEHLFSALSGLGIDNVLIEVNGAEIPIMDGSAAAFVYLIQEAGIQAQSAPKKYIRIKKKFRFEQGDKWIEVRPFDGFRVHYEINFEHPQIAKTEQTIQFQFNSQSFIEDISRARTFGFMDDVTYLRANNLALGASMDNAIVLDQQKVLNPDGLRYHNEFVRHKVLDLIGDLYLSGYAILGELHAYKVGHALNNQFLRQLLKQQASWEFVTSTQPNQDHSPVFEPVAAY